MENYLTELALKIQDVQQKREDAGMPRMIAQRVVFFDRTLLLFLLENVDWISGHVKTATRPHATRLADAAVRYAYDIVAIHNIMFDFRHAIECLYFDKSSVKTTEYCDYGIYRIAGRYVFYAPIYQKGIDKAIEEQRVHIGKTSRLHDDRIGEYITAFERLWTDKKRRKELAEQSGKADNLSFSHGAMLTSQYEGILDARRRLFPFNVFQRVESLFQRQS